MAEKGMSGAGELLPRAKGVPKSGRGCPEREGRASQDICCRAAALVSTCVPMRHGRMIEERPDAIDNMKPVLYDIIWIRTWPLALHGAGGRR